MHFYVGMISGKYLFRELNDGVDSAPLFQVKPPPRAREQVKNSQKDLQEVGLSISTVHSLFLVRFTQTIFKIFLLQ